MGMKRGSKVDYWLSDDGLVLIEAWCRDGCTQAELANKIGITLSNLKEWKNKYEEIAKAMSQGKELIDYKVENALLKSALGFTTKEIKVTIGKKIFNGETVELLKETTTKEVAPNVQACLSWLNNRQFDKWKRNRDRAMELNEEDSNISITIVRGPKDDLGDNVNREVTFTPGKKEAEKEKEPKQPAEEIDDEWAGWDEEEEGGE